MPFEHQIVDFWEWLAGDPRSFLFLQQETWGNLGFFFGSLAILFVLSLIGPCIWYLVAAVKHGPVEGFYVVAKSIFTAFSQDLPRFSLRRTLAIAGLAVREAIRNKVLVGLGIFLLVLLFAGLFLGANNSNPAKIYLTFVLQTTNYLVLIMALFLSAFSLPNDIKNRTIYTVVTKPIRSGEIVLGRIIGFAAVGSVMVVSMCVISYFFVWRGLAHTHEVAATDFQPIQATRAGEPSPGKTARTLPDTTHHSHEIRLGSDGQVLKTELAAGHTHRVTVVGDGASAVYKLGPNVDDLIARAPVFGKMRIMDRDGSQLEKGVNVGNEWTYRGYIEGGSKMAAIWKFRGISEQAYGPALPLELNTSVFRTFKGRDIEKTVLGEYRVRNPDQNARVQASGWVIFPSAEFRYQPLPIPRQLPNASAGGKEVDLYKDMVSSGEVEIEIRCAEHGQYFGFAQPDVYLHQRDGLFFANFLKGYLGIWLQMVLVTCFGVAFSTFLSGPIAWMATLSAVGLGLFGETVRNVFLGMRTLNVEGAGGGGPIESAIRIFTQQNLESDLDLPRFVMDTVKSIDFVMMGALHVLTYILPDFTQFDTSRFVANGFNIYNDLVAQHLCLTLVYVSAVSVVGYFFLKTREIAE